ncbi:substrate-binding domain-containing protein [Paenibacillus sp. TRM 82003]|uniref:sugar ABC transporter substrate-binding protein n=1 Tax=Kineococcus sp. TRM81007 TaxID=2925831 RepID=UPI001F58C38B|nr:substrate-binding domain-containing protein [Kineococcus sp. TRM81007]MCI2238638.1 substrate-binding domain-containing protein [Kineococcus sp. TRM81007]MCI3927300.1 substrate-binding domain-containing protein [Paenibacillus sp. TRM 82003]
MNRTPAKAAATLAALATLVLAGCGGDASDAPAAGGERRVAFLAPSTSLRALAYDYPNFAVRLQERCGDCVVDLHTAADQAEQNRQGERALADGAEALVVVAADGAEAASLLRSADAAGVPVVAYDRLVKDAPLDYYVSFDGGAVGEIGARAILDAVGERAGQGAVVMLQGDPADNNAGLFAAGAHSVLDGEVEIAADRSVAGWSAEQAEVEMAAALRELGGRELLGVYTSYDGLAAGALEALTAAGYGGVPITGQDAEVAALQRILAGTQTMTVFKDLPAQARTTADLVADVLAGEEPATTTTTDNGDGAVPTVLLQPEAVTRADIRSKVLDSGYTTAEALCAGAASALCQEAGITG